MIQFSTAIVVESKGPVAIVSEIIAAHSVTTRPRQLGELPCSIPQILQKPNGSCTRTIQHQMIQFATAVVVESKGPVAIVSEIIAAHSATTRPRQLGELPCSIPQILQKPNGSCTRTIQHQMIQFATAIVVESKGPVAIVSEIIAAHSVTTRPRQLGELPCSIPQILQKPNGSCTRTIQHQMIQFATAIVVESKGPVAIVSEIIAAHSVTTRPRQLGELPCSIPQILQKPNGSCTRTIQHQMIQFATAIVVESKGPVAIVSEIIAAHSVTTRPRQLGELPCSIPQILQKPNGSCTRTIQHQMIQFATAIVVESKGPVAIVSEIIAAHSVTTRPRQLGELPCSIPQILQKPNGSCAGTMQHQMIQFATAIVVESKGPVAIVSEIIAAHSVTTRPRQLGELPCSIPQILQKPNGSCAGTIQHQMIQFATAVVVESKGPVATVFETIPADSVTTRPRQLGELPCSIPQILQKPNGSCTRTMHHQMIQFATDIVVESKGPVAIVSEIIAAHSVTTRPRQLGELPCSIPQILQKPNGSCTRTVPHQMIQFATAVVVESKGSVATVSEIIAAHSVTTRPRQ